MRIVEMAFLPNVKLPCDICHSARSNPETLTATWHGKHFRKVLQIEVHSILVIEHNLNLIVEANLIIHLGPKGRDRGGIIIAQGTPKDVVKAATHTARSLLYKF